MYSNLLQIRYHLVHYLEDFVIIPKFFYLRLLQYITIGLLHFFSGVPALRYFAVRSSPLITSSFERFP